MPNIPRSNHRPMRDRDAGDKGIPNIDRLPQSLSLGGQIGSTVSGLGVERQNTMFEIFADHAIKPLPQPGFATAIWQNGESIARLEQGDAGNENGFGCLGIQPIDNSRAGLFLHQLGHHIGIQDNQSSSAIGSIA